MNPSSINTPQQIPVTLGNIVGGMIFVGLILYGIHAKNLRAE